jgi:hypothetical protein
MKILSVVIELLHDKGTDRYDKANRYQDISITTNNEEKL